MTLGSLKAELRPADVDIYARFNCKRKNGAKYGWKKGPLEGDRRLMANVIKYFHNFKEPLP